MLEHERAYGSSYNYYEYFAGVYSPYAYTYSGKEKDIDRIAYILGEMYIEDMKKEDANRSFTITQVHEYSAHVYSEQDLNDWLNWMDRVEPLEFIITKNQWLCDYICRFDYSGGITPIGQQKPGSEYYGSLTTDGSGEFQRWIIQKTGKDTYVMRGLQKCMISKEPPDFCG